jgi:hypothetical protein
VSQLAPKKRLAVVDRNMDLVIGDLDVDETFQN